MSPRIGFFKALYGTCCGTAVFDELRQVSWKRTIWHLLVLAFLISLAVGYARGQRLGTFFKATEIAFSESFGENLYYADGAFWPTRQPEKSRSLDLPFGGKLSYVGVGQKAVSPAETELVKNDFWIIWRGATLVNLARIDDARWSMLERQADGQLKMQVIENPDTIRACFTGNSHKKVPTDAEKLSTAELFRSIRVIGQLWLCGGMLVQTLVVTVLYTGLFMLVFRFSGARNLRTLSLSEMWKCGIYAGFPALLVAMCFPLFALPWLSFDTVYMIGLMIYWMVVTNRLERDARRKNNAELQ